MHLSVSQDHVAAALTWNGNGKVINNTARRLCPKKALNRTNLTKSNYSGSGRRGKPLEVRIRFLGSKNRGRTARRLVAPSVWCSQVGARMGARTQLGGGPTQQPPLHPLTGLPFPRDRV